MFNLKENEPLKRIAQIIIILAAGFSVLSVFMNIVSMFSGSNFAFAALIGAVIGLAIRLAPLALLFLYIQNDESRMLMFACVAQGVISGISAITYFANIQSLWFYAIFTVLSLVAAVAFIGSGIFVSQENDNAKFTLIAAGGAMALTMILPYVFIGLIGGIIGLLEALFMAASHAIYVLVGLSMGDSSSSDGGDDDSDDNGPVIDGSNNGESNDPFTWG